MTASENTIAILEHKRLVSMYLRAVIADLLERSTEHDYSKFSEAEFDTYETATVQLKNLVYGSDEYKAALRSMKPALLHHYKVNRHHPEHFSTGITGMNLLDILEMLCDWLAAVERMKDGDIHTSLTINKERFAIGDQLYTILQNTLDVLR